MDVYITIAVGKEEAAKLIAPDYLGGVANRALGGAARYRATEGAEDPSRGYRFWVSFAFHPAAGHEGREIHMPGSVEFLASGEACVGIALGEREAGYPGRDLGAFLTSCGLPLLQALRARLAVVSWMDQVPAADIVAAANEGRLGVRAQGYYLSATVVQAIGKGAIKTVFRAMAKEHDEELAEHGLKPNASAQEIDAVHGSIITPRPVMIDADDGAVLLYGLVVPGRRIRWARLGL